MSKEGNCDSMEIFDEKSHCILISNKSRAPGSSWGLMVINLLIRRRCFYRKSRSSQAELFSFLIKLFISPPYVFDIFHTNQMISTS